MADRHKRKGQIYRFEAPTKFAVGLLARQHRTTLQGALDMAARAAAERLDLAGRVWMDLYDEHPGVCLLLVVTTQTPVTERCASELRRWKTRKKHDTLVFPNPQKSGPLVKVSKSWASLLEEACVQSVTRHDMRHNFVSQLQRAGVNDTVIADLTGHRTLTQLKRYSHSRDEARREAVARLPLAQSLRSQKQPIKPKTGH